MLSRREFLKGVVMWGAKKTLDQILSPNVSYAQGLENIPSYENGFVPVTPNDIIGQTRLKFPVVLTNGETADENSPVFVLIKQNGGRFYLSQNTVRMYYESYALADYWLSPDLKTYYEVTSDGKHVRSGPIDAPHSTYGIIRNYDLPSGGFSAPPSIGETGYVVTIKNFEELDVGEKNPHHGGTFWKAPEGYRIISAVFGRHNHQKDMLLTLQSISSSEINLYWLYEAIPWVTPEQQEGCYYSTNSENHCEMEVIRDEQRNLRRSDQQLELIPIPNTTNIYNAVLIWNKV